MYRKDYEKTVECMKSAAEIAKDYSNMKRCEENLHQYDRIRAWTCLQDMFREYAIQIEAFGSLVDGRHIKKVKLEDISDQELQAQLKYIGQRIPVYFLLKTGEEAVAKSLYNWLDSRYNN